ncbi:MAG: aspartyl protease family protein [Verrucomicrobiota bacterium]|nr:aspartyl protease family protein [Verrucomicrobiota bacterium]
MRVRGLVGIGLLMVASLAVARPNEREPPAGATPVQLTRGPQNHLLIPATVNGHPASFLLDTGVDLNFLEADRAKGFGVATGGAELASGGRLFPRGSIAQLRLGNLSLGKSEVALYNPAQFRGPVPGRGGKAADGIIGLELLRSYGAVINCRTQQLFFQSDPARPLDLSATTKALGFTRIPIQKSARGFLSVPCNINGRNGALVIDTGAFVTVFNQAALRALDLKEAPSGLKARTAAGLVRPLELAQLDNLRIGGVAIAPQRFAVMDLFAAQKPLRTYTPGVVNRIEYYDARDFKARLDIWGLLGSELLYQHQAVIDLQGMNLFLK